MPIGNIEKLNWRLKFNLVDLLLKGIGVAIIIFTLNCGWGWQILFWGFEGQFETENYRKSKTTKLLQKGNVGHYWDARVREFLMDGAANEKEPRSLAERVSGK